MGNKKTVLISVSYLTELSEENINTDYGTLEKITNQISESKNYHLDDIDISLKWNCTSSLILDSTNLNCGKCSKCGQWTTDREKSDAVQGLCNGATVDDKLLCDDCLPLNHRWAF